MFAWTVQVEVSKGTSTWTRSSASLPWGQMGPRGSQGGRVRMGKVVFSWTCSFLTQHFLVAACPFPSPAIPLLHFLSSRAQEEANWLLSVLPKFWPLHVKQEALLMVSSWALCLCSLYALERWKLPCFITPGVLWQVRMEPEKNHLRALIGFQAPQVTVLAKVKAVLTVVKKAWWQIPGAALAIP